jgi:hypothetical protein
LFLFRTDSVFCHHCVVQEGKGNLKDQRSKEDAYIIKGFSSWKKAPKCFQAHQDSACHKTASAYQLIIPQCRDVGELMDSQLTKRRATERKYLLKVIQCLRYLGRQGIALQGSDGNDNLTQLLRLLGTNDQNILNHLDGKTGYKYIHSDVQNEILNIMATLTLQEKLKVIQERRFFSIIADEGTDVSNKEQLSFCLRTVDDNLDPFEDFIGFHQLENIKSDTIVRVIKDILVRLNLTLDNCRGQTYDGASNMMGKKSGVSTQILAEQPKAVAIHCQGHSLSLSIKSLTNGCDILRDTLSVVREICILVKFSPKRENLLRNINESIERGEEEFEPIKKLTKLSLTRWTVRAECMKRIIGNYQSLLHLWDECLEEKLDQETRARILGCKNQMESFKFFFGLNLSYKLYAMTDNLSKSLQATKMSAIKGRKSADLVITTLKDIRKDNHFQSFFTTVQKAANSTKEIDQPSLPRKRKRPNYSILQYVTGYEGPASNAYHPETTEEYFKQMYFEALDAIVNAMEDRFEQPALKKFMNVEELFLKTIENQDTSAELEILKTDFHGDFNADQLASELHLVQTIFKGSKPVDFRDICKTLQAVDKEIRPMIKNIWTITRIVLTSGATSATPERSFSMQRRVKTWLRSTMGQKRYNSLSLLNAHTDVVDSLSLIEVAERFTAVQDKRKNEFGTFKESDL